MKKPRGYRVRRYRKNPDWKMPVLILGGLAMVYLLISKGSQAVTAAAAPKQTGWQAIPGIQNIVSNIAQQQSAAN
jgi:hypothetical protein